MGFLHKIIEAKQKALKPAADDMKRYIKMLEEEKAEVESKIKWLETQSDRQLAATDAFKTWLEKPTVEENLGAFKVRLKMLERAIKLAKSKKTEK